MSFDPAYNRAAGAFSDNGELKASSQFINAGQAVDEGGELLGHSEAVYSHDGTLM